MTEGGSLRTKQAIRSGGLRAGAERRPSAAVQNQRDMTYVKAAPARLSKVTQCGRISPQPLSNVILNWRSSTPTVRMPWCLPAGVLWTGG